MSDDQNIEEVKRPTLLALSGGLDSTFLLYACMKDNKSVDIVTANYSQFHAQSKRQNIAIKKVIKEIKKIKKEESLPGCISEIRKYQFTPYHRGALKLGQNVPWLSMLLQNLRDIDQDVMLGYINGDSVLPYLNDTRLAWSHMLAASAIDSRYYQLYTPLVNTKKYQILEQIPSRLLKLVTWSEGTQAEDDCGSCPSCMSMQVAYEEYRIRNRVNKLCQEFKERIKAMAVKRKLSQNPKISNVRLKTE